jgi:thiol-disulfide isomerase/thioredoxin
MKIEMTMSRTFRWTLASFAALALAWTTITAEMPWVDQSFGGHVTPPPGQACPADAKPAPFNYALKDINDKPVRLADYKGKVILLDFWATWCGPCKVEIPWFIEFQQKYGAKGLQVIGVSVDDTLDRLVPYVREMKMTYPVLQGLGREDLQDAYGPMIGLPVTVLISRGGKICGKHVGLGSKEQFEEQIKALL